MFPSNPLVSIITTYYNSVQLGDFVKSSMDCLLNQTYKNIEFICVNDGSLDSTLEDLEFFAKQDDRIKIFTKENQKYAQYSKGFGQEKASGDFIFLFDHDDIIDYNTIEKCLKTFEKHPELEIVTPIVKAKYTDGNIKYISNLNECIKSKSEFRFKKISGKDAIKNTVGRYDINIRGLYRSHIFKSHSFRFTEPLLNADEIVERLIFEEAKFIGSCDAVYTHYIYPDSSAKMPSLKKIDISRTDVLLRKIFQSKGIYDARKEIFELTAYRNFINSIKTYHHFSKKISTKEKKEQKERLRGFYRDLNKKIASSQFRGFAKIYHNFLVFSFPVMMFYYKLKP